MISCVIYLPYMISNVYLRMVFVQLNVHILTSQCPANNYNNNKNIVLSSVERVPHLT